MRYALFIIPLFLSGCMNYSIAEYLHDFVNQHPTPAENKILKAAQYINFNEQSHRSELKAFTGVDPVRTEWCAAFINAVLRDSGVPGSDSVSEHPLLARSFLDWGTTVENPRAGDLVVFPRGDQSWQGHVGFYLNTVNINGKEYYQILGGNQNNAVTIELYPADKALSIRRYPSI